MRSRVSFRFFADAFKKLIGRAEVHRRTFRGYRLYGMDGLELVLPREKDILAHGCVGKAVGQYRETHYPRMYVLHCYDVLSEVTKAVEYSNQNEELTLAEKIIPTLEEKSISLYDRAFPSGRLIIAHRDAGNCFIARLSTSSFKQAVALLGLKIKRRVAIIEGVKIRFIKVRNTKTGEDMLFMTNLPEYWVEPKTISALYGLRWEVESSFRDWVDTHKIEQWHSKKMNGILQEFFASLWLINYSRILILLESEENQLDPLSVEYEKPNFKLILDTVIEQLKDIFLGRFERLRERIKNLITRTTRLRKRRSRSYRRVLRGSQSPYPYDNQVWNPQFTGVVSDA
jgi:hypothetical protein